MCTCFAGVNELSLQSCSTSALAILTTATLNLRLARTPGCRSHVNVWQGIPAMVSNVFKLDAVRAVTTVHQRQLAQMKSPESILHAPVCLGMRAVVPCAMTPTSVPREVIIVRHAVILCA